MTSRLKRRVEFHPDGSPIPKSTTKLNHVTRRGGLLLKRISILNPRSDWLCSDQPTPRDNPGTLIDTKYLHCKVSFNKHMVDIYIGIFLVGEIPCCVSTLPMEYIKKNHVGMSYQPLMKYIAYHVPLST